MKRDLILRHEFVEYIPKELQDGIIYVSVAFATVAHKCCCGCGNEVITPLSPADWKLTFDGESISLDPSIGNWSFACQSHYWIKRNRVRWAHRLSLKEVEAGRAYDRLARARYFDGSSTLTTSDTVATVRSPEDRKLNENLWQRIKNWAF